MSTSEKVQATATVYCQGLVTDAAREACKIVGGATAMVCVVAVAADCAMKWGELNKAQFLEICSMSWDQVKASYGEDEG